MITLRENWFTIVIISKCTRHICKDCNLLFSYVLQNILDIRSSLNQKLCMNKKTYRWRQERVEVINSCQSKISNFDRSIIRHQRILRFDVSVHYSMAVKIINTTKKLPHQVFHFFRGQARGRTVFEEFLKILYQDMNKNAIGECKLVSQ